METMAKNLAQRFTHGLAILLVGIEPKIGWLQMVTGLAAHIPQYS
jgi:hypothetical protein